MSPLAPFVSDVLDRCLSADRPALSRALRNLKRPITGLADIPEALHQRIEASQAARLRRHERLPRPHFPADLPVNQRREEIAQLIHDHQVVIVCGETGSGKTTQLPKICLELGRGASGLIGHTQPRRLAARATATRIAEELSSELGTVVGYKVRFTDHTRADSYIKLMTDGILLAETQGDPTLSAYDTIIIDEAHERSLNIDFLLGYLRQLLPRRPDLKVIVTSATLDAERFAQHFAVGGKLAPIIEVSGRLYPIEMRYRPLEGEESKAPAKRNDRTPPRPQRLTDVYEGIVDAVSELQREGSGDVLVFLPGEREIREAAEALRKDHLPGTEILPLFARQSAAEQARVFSRSSGRRVVLATNVAETSLTVPGIRYVVDSGLARVNRYSHRNKVELLQIEKIAQSAARQRAGRCGRVDDGICIRLYDEEDFNRRPPHTDPEILRSSLAGVILRMKSLRLGAVEEFPFIDAPTPRMINDGYQLLNELGAVDDDNELTPVGRELAKLPLDPKIGRMILAARDRQCLEPVLVIAAALSVQDPRERPPEQAGTADQAHAKFRVAPDDKAEPRSEFLWYWHLWNVFDQVWKHESSSKQKAWCKQHFLSWMRMREWRDVYGQLHSLCAEHGWLKDAVPAKAGTEESSGQEALDSRLRGNDTASQRDTRRKSAVVPAKAGTQDAPLAQSPDAHIQANDGRSKKPKCDYEAVHKALLSGLLGHIGLKLEDATGPNVGAWQGARGIKFWPHPSSYMAKRAGKWLMAAELIDTSRLYARCIARIEPEWVEEVGAHLIKRSVYEPHWEKKHGAVRAWERGVLHGIALYARRPVPYAHIDPAACRDIFIREGLVEGELDDGPARAMPFFQHNRKLVAEIERLEHKMRRPDVLVDPELIHAFYDNVIPLDVTDLRAFEAWRKQAERKTPRLLHLERDQLMRHEAAGVTSENFPASFTVLGQKLKLSYVHQPGEPDDGVTLTVPLAMLNQIPAARCEWLVPGLLEEKVVALLKTVPQKHRHRLQPIGESAGAFMQALEDGVVDRDEPLLRALQRFVEERVQLKLPIESFRPENLPAHAFMNFRVIDEHGRVLAQSRDLADLRARLKSQTAAAFQNAQMLSAFNEAKASSDSPLPMGGEAGGSAGTARSPSNGVAQARLPGAGVRAEGTTKGGRPDSPPPNVAAGPGEGGNSATSEAPPQQLTNLKSWSFGRLPELLEVKVAGRTVIGFPALHDDGDSVSLRAFDTEEEAAKVHRKGLARLFALELAAQVKAIEKLPGVRELSLQFIPFGTEAELKSQLVSATLIRTCLLEPLPQDAAGFTQRAQEAKPRITLVAQELMRLAGQLLTEHASLQKRLTGLKTFPDVVADIQGQVAKLMPKDFLLALPWERLAQVPRYLKGANVRIDKLRTNPARDAQLMSEWKSVAQPFEREVIAKAKAGVNDPRLEEFRWLLEELRVSLFAQELKTPTPVSVKRLQKIWESRPR